MYTEKILTNKNLVRIETDKKIIENLKEKVLFLENVVKKYQQIEKTSLTKYVTISKSLEHKNDEYKKYKNYLAHSRETVYCIKFVKPINTSLTVKEQRNDI